MCEKMQLERLSGEDGNYRKKYDLTDKYKPFFGYFPYFNLKNYTIM